MTASVVKFLPLLLCWLGIGIVVIRAAGARVRSAHTFLATGYVAGIALAFLLARKLPGEAAYGAVRIAISLVFLAMVARAAVLLYVRKPLFSADATKIVGAFWLLPSVAGFFSSLLSMLRLPLGDEPVFTFATVLVGVAIATIIAFYLNRLLPRQVKVTPEAGELFVTAVLLFLAAQSVRLDLFAPLGMKVMKFAHDFVHQFFESMLIPDHLFFRNDVWSYIGYLFSNSVGLWAGMMIWFVPTVLVIWSIWAAPLPQVSHIRQGALRRKELARFHRERRYLLIVPLISAGIFALAILRSMNPAVEYWDPKPIEVQSGQGGIVSIPMRGEEYDLADGKIHKFLLKEGRTKARFFVIKKDNGFAVALDACSICQPEGYGQTEGAVLCYYCKTLIPIETVGRLGGCNPVPVKFVENGNGVSVAAVDILNLWTTTVQATTRVPGRGK